VLEIWLTIVHFALHQRSYAHTKSLSSNHYEQPRSRDFPSLSMLFIHSESFIVTTSYLKSMNTNMGHGHDEFLQKQDTRTQW